ncbi:MAG: Ig-like domain-containing protein, partial [Planctomycetota bacterium]
LLLAVFAAVFLPMSGGSLLAQDTASVAEKTPASDKPTRSSRFPIIVKSVPEFGATEVDPSLDAIRVTFDRDMKDGYSWIGDPRSEEYPRIDKKRTIEWIDGRTCVLPVRLAKGRFYQIGINQKGAEKFKSVDGMPAEHRVLSFATKGAKRSAQRKARVPQIVEMTPANGAESVDPSLKSMSATFDTKMAPGMSWVKTGGWWPGYDGGRARWSRDGKTCTLPVELEPDATYEVSLNGSRYINFQSRYGVPIETTIWSFTTAAE